MKDRVLGSVGGGGALGAPVPKRGTKPVNFIVTRDEGVYISARPSESPPRVALGEECKGSGKGEGSRRSNIPSPMSKPVCGEKDATC